MIEKRSHNSKLIDTIEQRNNCVTLTFIFRRIASVLGRNIVRREACDTMRKETTQSSIVATASLSCVRGNKIAQERNLSKLIWNYLTTFKMGVLHQFLLN